MTSRTASSLREAVLRALPALLVVLSCTVQAEVVVAEEDQDPLPYLAVLDAPRDYLGSSFVELVNGIDRFFASERDFQESSDNLLQLEVSHLSGYGGDHQYRFAGRAKVHLPNTEKKLHVLLESDPDRRQLRDAPGTLTPSGAQPPAAGSYAAGVRYEGEDKTHWHNSFDAGLKFAGLNSTPFVRGRTSYERALSLWYLKAAATVFWFNSTGAGESNQLDFERPLAEGLLLRASSSAVWLHDRQNMDLRQDISLFHTYSARVGLLYQASAIGASRPQTQVMDYVLMVSYRQRLHRHWMFLELGPQLHFPRERNFRLSPQFGVRLEMVLDGKH